MIDPAVGLSGIARLGTKLSRGQPIATIHAGRESQAKQAEAAVRAAVRIGDSPVEVPELIRERIG